MSVAVEESELSFVADVDILSIVVLLSLLLEDGAVCDEFCAQEENAAMVIIAKLNAVFMTCV